LPRLAYADSIQGEIPADPMLVRLGSTIRCRRSRSGACRLQQPGRPTLWSARSAVHDNALGDGQPGTGA
jgi:hypothetical protein